MTSPNSKPKPQTKAKVVAKQAAMSIPGLTYPTSDEVPPLPDNPISVGNEVLPTVMASGLRYMIMMIGSFAVAREWVSPESLPGIATVVITVATFTYGLWRTQQRKNNLITAAAYAPNEVAIVRDMGTGQFDQGGE